MSHVFLQILNRSISASYLLLAVLLLRLLFRRAPKWCTVALWGIVAIRLICPFSIPSVFSLIPSAETVSPDIMMDQTPEIHTGIPIVNQVVNPMIGSSFAPDPATSANPLQVWIPTAALLWTVGMAALLAYAVIGYVRVKRTVATAVLLRENMYQSENVASPFVLGIFKPNIYLPFYMSGGDMEHVIAHELAHIRRKDHLWKPLGFFLLTLHWFNPLLWIGYVLFCRDIELACDEKVIKDLDRNARADYSQALLSCSVKRRRIAACPLAFGEVDVKHRVKSVLHYKKPAFWILLVAIVAGIVLSVCFLTDPVNPDPNLGETDPGQLSDAAIALMEQYPEFFGLDASAGLDVFVSQINPNSYIFGLLPHSEQEHDFREVWALGGTDAEEMRIILSTYALDEEDIYIIPWHNPVSSYIGEWQIIRKGEDPEEKRAAYVARIQKMLFE